MVVLHCLCSKSCINHAIDLQIPFQEKKCKKNKIIKLKYSGY